MRLVRISAPAGAGADVAQTAFSVGIEQVSIFQAEAHSPHKKPETKDVIDVQTSTPTAKKFLDELLTAAYYDSEKFSVAIRQPRAIIGSQKFSELTSPFVEPSPDIAEELWQFSHITISFVGRFFIAACLLAYGLIQQNTLTIIAGLLFLPLLPLLLSISFGAWTKQWRLIAQAALAFLVAVAILFAGGAAIGAISSPPIKYDEFSSLGVAFLISLGVGVAAVLANTDDVGRRELIGLAATAQTAIIPVWFGIGATLGFSANTENSDLTDRATVFAVNVATIMITSLIVYALLPMKSNIFGRLKK